MIEEKEDFYIIPNTLQLWKNKDIPQEGDVEDAFLKIKKQGESYHYFQDDENKVWKVKKTTMTYEGYDIEETGDSEYIIRPKIKAKIETVYEGSTKEK